MLRKICILLSLLVVAACSPKDAEVESKPFEQPSNDGFETMSLQVPLELNRASWFFWKKPEDMSTAMRLGAGLEMIGKNIAELSMKKMALNERKENYALESLGPDNKQIWEELSAQINASSENWKAAYDRLEAERAKPEEERDQNLITQLESDISIYSAEFDRLREQIEIVEQQSGVEDFGQNIRSMREQIFVMEEEVKQLQQTAQTYQQQLAQIVELVPNAPKLKLQETETGLYIELVDFQSQGVDCNTTTGTIRDVVYKKSEGYIEFTTICKQPEWSDASKLVSYKIILEKIPTAPNFLLSGNMGRCVDILPNLGKCEGGLSTGVIKYQ